MRRNQKKKKEKITKENKQTNSEIECTQVRGGFLGLGAGEYVQKPHKKNWGAKIEPAGCRQKLYFSGLCAEFPGGKKENNSCSFYRFCFDSFTPESFFLRTFSLLSWGCYNLNDWFFFFIFSFSHFLKKEDRSQAFCFLREIVEKWLALVAPVHFFGIVCPFFLKHKPIKCRKCPILPF